MRPTYEIELDVPGRSVRVERVTGWRPLRIGSAAQADLVVDDPGVAPLHAEIAPGPRGCLLDARGECLLDGRALAVPVVDLPLPDQCEIALARPDGPRIRVRRLAYQEAQDPQAHVLVRCRAVEVGAVVRDATLELRAGELVAILGRSGSGKTTLLHALAGLVEPTAGEVELVGPSGADGEPRALRVAYVPQRDPVFGELTVRQTLDYAARLQDEGRSAPPGRVAEVARELEIAEVLDRPCRALSGGQARRVAIAMALAGAPDLLLADEPDSGLDPYRAGQMMGLLLALAQRRRIAIAITTHSLLYQNLMHRVVLLAGGRVVASGTPPEVARQFGVRDLHRVYALLASREEAPAEVRRYGPLPARRAPRRFKLARAWALAERSLLRRAVAPWGMVSAVGLPLFLGAAIRLAWWSPPASAAEVTAGAVAVARVGLVAAVWLGLTAATGALVSQREVARYEQVVGVAVRELLLAEALSLAVLVAGQALFLGAILSVGTWLAPAVLGPGLLAAGACGIALGLAVSAWSPSTQAAYFAVPLAMIPQILYGSLFGFPIAGWTPQGAGAAMGYLAFAPALEALFGAEDALRGGWTAASDVPWRAATRLGGMIAVLGGLAALGLARSARPERRA